VPSLSPSAENHLLQLVHCYVTSSADVTADDDVTRDDVTVYDVSRVEEADADVIIETREQSNDGRWTVDNSQ